LGTWFSLDSGVICGKLGHLYKNQQYADIYGCLPYAAVVEMLQEKTAY